MPTQGESRFNIEARNIEATHVLSALASRSGLQIVVRAKEKSNIPYLSLANKSLNDALRDICVAAHLTCELQKDIWVVDSPVDASLPQLDHTPIIDDLNFEDVGVTDLLSLISAQFKVPITLAPGVGGTIPYIRLHDKTVREALETVALAADLKVGQAPDGTFILSPLPPVK